MSNSTRKQVVFFSFIVMLFVQFISANIKDFRTVSELVYKKDLKGIDSLLSHGVNIDVSIEGSGSTVLLIACSLKDHVDVVEFLIKKGADVNIIPGRDGRTALMWAAGNSKKSVELLLAHGAKTRIKALDGMTAFIQSIYGVVSGQVTTEVCDMLLKKGEDINAQMTGQTAPGFTALMFAVKKGKPELVRYLLLNGANVNIEAYNGRTALMFAAKEGNKAIVEMLLANGADAAEMDKAGHTAKMLAEKKGHDEIVKMLEKAEKK